MKVDIINWKILQLLQTNARRSNTEIANHVGISSPAVAERIRKLEDAGIINRYHAKIEGREFTPTERRIIQMLLKLIFEDYKEAWSPVMDVSFEYLDNHYQLVFQCLTVWAICFL